MALVDANGVYAAPRFFQAAKQAGIKALVGAEVVLEDEPSLWQNRARFGPLGLVPDPRARPITVEPRGRHARRGSPSWPPSRDRLPQPLQAAHRRRARPAKGEARVAWDLLAEHADGPPLPDRRRRGAARPRAGRRRGSTPPGACSSGSRASSAAASTSSCSATACATRSTATSALVDLARAAPPAARRHQRRALRPAGGQGAPRRADLHPPPHDARHGRPPPRRPPRAAPEERRRDGARSSPTCPQALGRRGELAAAARLHPRRPRLPLPRVSRCRPARRPPPICARSPGTAPAPASGRSPRRAQAQIQKELDLIEKLDLAGYFLIVWDIVEFCQREKILAQGRGSAANSAVCYALVDHRRRSGEDGAPLRALPLRGARRVAGHRPRPAVGRPARAGDPARLPALRPARRGDDRERHHLPRPLGHPRGGQGLRLLRRSRSTSSPSSSATGTSTSSRGDARSRSPPSSPPPASIPRSGACSTSRELWTRIQNLPRHLGQHSGGMVIAAGRLDEVVPLEPAVDARPRRHPVGQGRLRRPRDHQGRPPRARHARRPGGDGADHPHPRGGRTSTSPTCRRTTPRSTRCSSEADTVGVFQVESRAQMASLPRNHPEKFYDIVIQVAIIRPGPIVGNMANPYFERRNGRAAGRLPASVPRADPRADARRADLPGAAPAHRDGGGGLHRRRGRGAAAGDGLQALGRADAGDRREAPRRDGRARDHRQAAGGDRAGRSRSFALYGFPESHAASFALIAYASAYLKAHHPTAFYLGLLNAWPMGFYHPATLVKDAQRHGVEVRPVDVQTLGGPLPLGGPRAARGGARSAHGHGAAGRGHPPRLPVRARPARPGGAVDRDRAGEGPVRRRRGPGAALRPA